MVGAIVKVGEGSLSMKEFEAMVAAGSRTGLMPQAAPAHGLYLVDVAYKAPSPVVDETTTESPTDE